MDDIQIGEYIRFEIQALKIVVIAKVVNIETLEVMKGFYHTCYTTDIGEIVNEIGITKHSFNIRDLMEEGDVIHYRVDNISTTLETKGYVEGVTEVSRELLENIKEHEDYHILSIVTKEQFKEVEYKVC